MALKLNEKYPGYMNAPSVDYPQGSFKNRTSPTSEDGSYFEEAWANDIQGLTQSILSYFDVTANGQVDKVGSSQYFTALTSSPTESRKGMPQVATQAQANAGSDDSTMLTPKKNAAAFGVGQVYTSNASTKYAPGITYTNSKPKPIWVRLRLAVQAGGSIGTGRIVVGATDSAFGYADANNPISINSIIPPGETWSYSLTNSTVVSISSYE